MTSSRNTLIRSSSIRLWQVVLTAFLMPWVIAASCVPGSGTLLDQQLTANFAPAAGDTGICPAVQVAQTNFLADALKTVTITVTGPTSNSRPEIRVLDNQGNVVANSGVTPTTQTTVTTFSPSARLTFTLQAFECAGAIAGNYKFNVVQAPL